MTFEYYSALGRLETDIAIKITKEMGRKVASTDISSRLIDLINQAIQIGKADHNLIAMIRLCLKLHPYSTDIQPLYALYKKVVHAYASANMPQLMLIISSHREKNLPLPVIISCGKYLKGAQEFQSSLQKHYFDLPPLIVRGDTTLSVEKYESGVLSFPVDDTYEGLPLKIMETYSFLSALDDHLSVLKIDDDVKVKPDIVLDNKKLSPFFTAGDYMGIAVQSIFHDRLCHQGKCNKPTPYSYTKPIRTAWARGALYYLSNTALQTLAQYYLRFPGVLEGELYEDKAVADILYSNNIMINPYAIETLLGLDTTSPER